MDGFVSEILFLCQVGIYQFAAFSCTIRKIHILCFVTLCLQRFYCQREKPKKKKTVENRISRKKKCVSAMNLPKCLHCVVFPARSHPSSTMRAPRKGIFLHIFVFYNWPKFSLDKSQFTFFLFGLAVKMCASVQLSRHNENWHRRYIRLH